MKLRRSLAVACSALTLAAVGALAPAAAPQNAGPVVKAENAYPQTRPSAGQYCRRIDRGKITRAKNGRRVRCTPEGSRQRWRYY